MPPPSPTPPLALLSCPAALVPAAPQACSPLLRFCFAARTCLEALQDFPCTFPPPRSLPEVRSPGGGTVQFDRKTPVPPPFPLSRSPICREELPAPHKGCSGVAPFHLPKQSTRRALIISMRGGCKSVEELGQGRWGLVTEKLL